MLTALTFENTEPTKLAAANLDAVPTIHAIFTEEKSNELTAALAQFDTNWSAFEPRVRANIERINNKDWAGAKTGLQEIKPYFEDVQGVNGMQQSLTTLVKEASISSELVSASAEELHATTQDSLYAAEQITNLSTNSYRSAEAQMNSIATITANVQAAGKGFAVVADEVRNLAEESRTSVQLMVHEIQRDIHTVMQSIQEEATRVQQGLLKSDEVRTVFSEIEMMISDVSTNTQEMSASIGDVSLLGKQIITHLENVEQLSNQSLTDTTQSKESAETQLSATEELSAASDALANLAEQLQSTIQHFKV